MVARKTSTSSTYGSHSELILNNAHSLADLGEHFGHDLYEAELCYLIEKEWVVKLDDVIWRRTKLGMYLDDMKKQWINTWLSNKAQETSE